MLMSVSRKKYVPTTSATKTHNSHSRYRGMRAGLGCEAAGTSCESANADKTTPFMPSADGDWESGKSLCGRGAEMNTSTGLTWGAFYTRIRGLRQV